MDDVTISSGAPTRRSSAVDDDDARGDGHIATGRARATARTDASIARTWSRRSVPPRARTRGGDARRSWILILILILII